MTKPSLALCLTLLSVPALQAQPAPPGMAQSGPLTAGAITLETSEVPYEVTLPGRAVAYEKVDIRPRVEGVISEISYEPGKPVKVGDLLFKIDNATYEAELLSAEADVASAEAELTNAGLTVDRYKQIEGTGISKADLQTAQADLQKAEASLKTAKAALSKAKLSLSWTEIRSPIAGVPDVADISVGSIVTSNQTDALTTVTRFDPIYVDVEEASVRILEIRDQIEGGILNGGKSLDIDLQLETGKMHSGKGKMTSPGTSVSTTTGTIALRLQFENPERVIIPGQFLRVTTKVGTRNAILVPQGATQRGSDGSLFAYVARDGKIAKAILTEAGAYQNSWVVVDGVSDGEQVLVDNIRNLKEGADVKTIAVEYVDGVIKEVASKDAADTGATGTDAPATSTAQTAGE
ncbi:efflux RND transporter periplasmic adaptor subunit [uncultured Cohaesibacter sp.]|uniref:efflux RND transporter periplasmic adaptor subunit n=1 Tax=uncultured Cohaesibacter sp. TaxID=1002546 RepID=UPI0029C62E74|nr:efflux RND transporter periplasmic adaptor subunit [uncultured Cohaesibacter sp.]